jgi:hypothetical protein
LPNISQKKVMHWYGRQYRQVNFRYFFVWDRKSHRSEFSNLRRHVFATISNVRGIMFWERLLRKGNRISQKRSGQRENPGANKCGIVWRVW